MLIFARCERSLRRRMAPGPLLWSLLAAAPAGCSSAAPTASPARGAPVAAGPAPLATAATATAAPTAVPAAQPAPVEDETEDWTFDNLAGTLDRPAPAASCDFDRYYRGTIGSARVSLLLTRTGSVLRGHVAYDAGHGELEVAGRLDEHGALTLTERAAGQEVGSLRGSCDPASGTIRGTWSAAGKSLPASLAPREAGGVALKEHRRVFGDRREDEPSCHWDVRSPAVFGLGDAGRTARINAALRVRFGTAAEEAEMERVVRRCAPGTDSHVTGWYSVEHNADGLLSVLHNGYVYLGPAAHGWWNAGADAMSIDIPSGRKLRLTDVVTSSRALRPVVRSCMEFTAQAIDPTGEMGGDAWWWEQAIQGVPMDRHSETVEERSPDLDPSSLRSPSFLVLPDGLAVLIRNQPTVSAALELWGPVIRWGALLRAGVLKKGSPVARLWQDEQSLAAGELACTRFFKPRWSERIPVPERAAAR